MADPTLSVLRPEVWPTLERRLFEASQRAASNTTRDTLLRPLELLSLMAADAADALGDDPLSAERLRMLLYLAAPYHALVDEARALGEAAEPVSGDARYEPGVLDHGGLAMLALAAMRVAPAGSEAMFVRTVHGLALWSAPAEVLGRLVPRLPEADGLAVMLETLYLLDTLGAALKAPLLRPFANDPTERARWKCLARLLEQDLTAAVAEARKKAKLPKGAPHWDGAFASGIEDVEPASGGAQALITGSFGARPPEALQVVFASPDHPPLPARVLSFKSNELRVEVPAGARPGWVGFSDDRLLAASNEFRAALRQLLPTMLRQQGCLRSSEVPRGLPPDIGSPDPQRQGRQLARPPRNAANRWSGPPAARTVHVAAPLAGTAAGPLAMPRILTTRTFQGARDAPLYSGQPLEVSVVVDPERVGPGLGMELRLFPAPPDHAALAPDRDWLPGAAFHFTVPPALLHDRLVLVAVLLAKGEPVGTRDLGPFTFAAPRKEQLVLVRPAVLGDDGYPQPPIESRTARRFLQRHAALHGVDLSVVELPWVDDELAVLASPLSSGEDARIPALLEALSRRAMLTPYLESAPWLLLAPQRQLARDPERALPSENPRFDARDDLAHAIQTGRGFAQSIPAEAARVVAVADPLGVPELMHALFAEETKRSDDFRRPEEHKRARTSPVPRLRLLGSFDEHEVRLEPVLEELRGAGPGAPVASGLTIATLDGMDRELLVTAPTCLRPGRPAQLAALVPVSPEVAAVEIRRGQRRLLRVERTAGRCELEAASLSEPTAAQQQTLHWRFTHTRNARPDVSLALGWGRLQTEVLRLDACDREPALRLTRYPHAQRLQLFASDGWNVAERDVLSPDAKPAAIDNAAPVQIRRLSDGRFFADVPEGWTAAWTIDGQALRGTGLVVKLAPGARGALKLEARHGGESPPVLDERRVEA